MEEGSLLQEALDAIRRSRSNGNGGSLRNTLVVDIVLVTDPSLDRIESLSTLVSRCHSINESLRRFTSSYPWFSGGDVPMFGIDVTEDVPHLRCCCSYGPSVADEWVMIGAMIEISKSFADIAIKFLDVDDGNILLIESADVLPNWIEKVGPMACEYRCWVSKGQVTLLRQNVMQEAFSLKDAVRCLRDNKHTSRLDAVQAAIEKRLNGFTFSPSFQFCDSYSRAAVLLPRKVAVLLRDCPQLLHCAIDSFERFCHSGDPPGKLRFEELVWTTHKIGRTSFALLRNLQSQTWQSDDYIPRVYRSGEVNRAKRTCQVESTPHIRHALQLGVRISAGLDYALALSSSIEDSQVCAETRMLHHWIRIDQATGGDGEWLRTAWRDGPNESTINLNSFIDCPILSVDLCPEFPCPLTYPRKQLKSIVEQQLKKSVDEDIISVIPHSSEVDDERWMLLTEEDLKLSECLTDLNVSKTIPNHMEPTNTTGEQSLEVFLDKFATFVESEADVDGVATADATQIDDEEPLMIDPQLFLNLLHRVLTSSPEEIANLTSAEHDDEIFGSSVSDVGDEEDDLVDMSNVLEAMDAELGMNSPEKCEIDTASDRKVSQDVLTMTGLIESVDASEGAPGPVRNILLEMSLGGKFQHHSV